MGKKVGDEAIRHAVSPTTAFVTNAHSNDRQHLKDKTEGGKQTNTQFCCV